MRMRRNYPWVGIVTDFKAAFVGPSGHISRYKVPGLNPVIGIIRYKIGFC